MHYMLDSLNWPSYLLCVLTDYLRHHSLLYGTLEGQKRMQITSGLVPGPDLMTVPYDSLVRSSVCISEKPQEQISAGHFRLKDCCLVFETSIMHKYCLRARRLRRISFVFIRVTIYQDNNHGERTFNQIASSLIYSGRPVSFVEIV